MEEEMWKVIKIKLEKTLKNYEIDRKIGQLTTDSLCTLFPTEMQAIIDYINNLQSQLKAKEEVIKEAREQLEKELEYSKTDCVPARRITCEKILEILSKGENNG